MNQVLTVKGELLCPKQVMNPELREAAVNGDVTFLGSLQNGDSRLQIILESAYVGVETPLHVALRQGHDVFAMNILDLNSALAGIPDECGFYPLHLAAARGYVNVVKKLLDIDRSLSCLGDKDGGTALSAAALNEKEDVLEVLYPAYKKEVVLRKALVGKGVTALSSAPACNIKQGLRQALPVDGDVEEELILHLCVVHNKLKSVKALVELDEKEANKKQGGICSPYEKLVEQKDAEGNTALHYAAAKKNTEMQAFLEGKMQNTDIKTRNKQGLTATNIKDGHYTGAKWRLNMFMLSSWDEWYKKDKKWINQMHNTLIILSTLVVTITFQAGIGSPPGGFSQEEEQKVSPEASPSPPKPAGIVVHDEETQFILFMYFDMIAFATSLMITLSLVSGSPLRHRFTTWLLVISVWLALSSMGMAFLFGTQLITYQAYVIGLIPYVLGTWMALTAIILLCHCVVLIHLFGKKIKEGYQWMLRCNKTGKPSEHKGHKKDEECGK